MSDWLSYTPSDFLLFSARTYYRLFELYNRAIWPGQILALMLGLVILSAASFAGGAVHTAHALMALRALEGVGFLLTVLPAPGMIRRLVDEQRLMRRSACGARTCRSARPWRCSWGRPASR